MRKSMEWTTRVGGALFAVRHLPIKAEASGGKPHFVAVIQSVHIMSSEEDTAPVASTSSAPQPSTTPKKGRKSASKPKKAKAKADHPKVSEMVIEAVGALKERKGSSVQAIKKYMSSQYKVDVEKLAPFIRKALKSGVETGKLVQTRGKGASGSFKLAPKEGKKSSPKPIKKTVKKANTANAKSTKVAKSPKAVAASPKSPKKVAVKGHKKAAAKSPKKPATVAAVKSATPKKAAKSPKPKVKKQTVRIWVQRPKVAKKTPVKKQQPKRALKPENPTKKTLSRASKK